MDYFTRYGVVMMEIIGAHTSAVAHKCSLIYSELPVEFSKPFTNSLPKEFILKGQLIVIISNNAAPVEHSHSGRPHPQFFIHFRYDRSIC